MSRVDIIEQLYRNMSSGGRIADFDRIVPPAPLSYFFTPTDVGDLRYIATSNRFAAKTDKKYKMINEIMNRRGWKIFSSGTNRAVYKFMEDQSILVKTALDSVGMSDTPNEYYNQQFIAPYCTKVFETTPCGTLGLFERCHPISSREEFRSVAEDVYDIIVNHLVGKYVIEDFGSDFFLNWVIRSGSYPVICDFPYVFELDGAKLYCNKPDPYSPTGVCGGEIDYDDGFNHLICKRCGKQYLARDLKKAKEGMDTGILITEREDGIDMRVRVVKGDEVIQEVDSTKSTSTYKRNTKVTKSGKVVNKMTPYEYRQAKRVPNIRVNVTLGEEANAEMTEKIAEAVEEKNSDDELYNQRTSVNDQPKTELVQQVEEDKPESTNLTPDGDIELNESLDQIQDVIDMCNDEIESAVSGTDSSVERITEPVNIISSSSEDSSNEEVRDSIIKEAEAYDEEIDMSEF